MQVAHLGRTRVKGCAHETLTSAALVPDGVEDDRRYALVDARTHGVLRTYAHPELITTDAARLAPARAPGGEGLAGARVEVEYWGRTIPAVLHGGDCAAFGARVVGADVLVAEAISGRFVYDAPISVVFRSELIALSLEGSDLRRWRANLVIDDLDDPVAAGELDSGALRGKRIRVGAAELVVTSAIPRCTVIEHDAVTGERDLDVLTTLAESRRGAAGLLLGVGAQVVVPSVVHVGDEVCWS